MFKSGLMLLSCIPQLNRLSSYLRAVNKSITKTLYISIDPNLLSSTSSPLNAKQKIKSSKELIQILPQIYAEANRCTPCLDVRVLHHSGYHRSHTSSAPLPRCLQFAPQVVFINGSNFSEDMVRKYLISEFDLNVQTIESIPESVDESMVWSDNTTDNERVYELVCLGGTFDNLHNGHKVLISAAQLRCDKCMTIGVTDETMIKKKTLWQLIQPIDVRIDELTKFVKDVDPFIDYNIVAISDPFGPAIVDQSLQCIVVSQETVRGAERINEIRLKADMKELDVIKVDLIEEHNKQNDFEEEKTSSSTLRIRKLGTILREPVDKPHLAKRPYIIGLTGGIASGKSSIAEKLKSFGAGVINCDLIAHQTYQTPESPAYKEIVEYFGPNILADDSVIDRRKLGSIVFEDNQKLKVLNRIVWPKLEVIINEKINEMKDKYPVIVLEIALLLEAQWEDKVHQIWVALIDHNEAITRLEQRNHLSREEAQKRIESQLSNEERVRKANVVFSTLWSPEFTLEQVKKAWNCLHRYLPQK